MLRSWTGIFVLGVVSTPVSSHAAPGKIAFVGVTKFHICQHVTCTLAMMSALPTRGQLPPPSALSHITKSALVLISAALSADIADQGASQNVATLASGVPAFLLLLLVPSAGGDLSFLSWPLFLCPPRNVGAPLDSALGPSSPHCAYSPWGGTFTGGAKSR